MERVVIKSSHNPTPQIEETDTVQDPPQFRSMPSHASVRLFESLPGEVLALFVEHIVTRPFEWRIFQPDLPFKTDFPSLKAFRLTARRFAYNTRLMEILFHGISLVATNEHVMQLEKGHIPKIAPYVQRLTFYPPFHSWSLSFDDFKDIVISQAVRQYCYQNRIWTGTTSLVDLGDGYYAFIKQKWAGKLPFSDSELSEGYIRHVEMARSGKEFLGSERLKKLWTGTLKMLRKCRKFAIDTQNYEGTVSDLPDKVGCSVVAHDHDRSHREDICLKSAGCLGDALFATCIECLSQAQAQPLALDLKFASTGRFNWVSLTGWKQLDLSHLKKLKFHPRAPGLQEWGPFSSDWEEEFRRLIAEALDMTLRKCQGRLKYLFVERESHLTWPAKYTMPLPELQHLELNRVLVDNGELARLLPLLPKLQRLNLRCTRGVYGWKQMLDAIRDHPRRMDLALIKVHGARKGPGIFFHCNTADGANSDKDSDPRLKVNRPLANYLAGKGRWNKCLRVEFDGDDPNEVDSEGDE